MSQHRSWIDEDDWFVPGGAVVDEHAGKLRLRPPPDWRRDILVIERTPPSMNDNAIRSNWRGFQKEKKAWQQEIGQLLMLARVPKRNRRAIAGAFMRAADRRHRDSGNFKGVVEKALGDALVIATHMPVKYRYIPDDDEAHFCFGGIEFEPDTGSPRTTIHLFTQPEETA